MSEKVGFWTVFYDLFIYLHMIKIFGTFFVEKPTKEQCRRQRIRNQSNWICSNRGRNEEWARRNSCNVLKSEV